MRTPLETKTDVGFPTAIIDADGEYIASCPTESCADSIVEAVNENARLRAIEAAAVEVSKRQTCGRADCESDHCRALTKLRAALAASGKEIVNNPSRMSAAALESGAVAEEIAAKPGNGRKR